MAYSMYWCFTLNNPEHLLDIPPYVTYCIYQHEIGEGREGTEHFQGYVELDKKMRLTGLKKWLPKAHWEPRKGTAQQASDYCSKTETHVDGPWISGTMRQLSEGKRNDLEDVRDAILRQGMTKRAALEEFPGVVAKYPRFIDYLFATKMDDAVTKVLVITPRPWQQDVLDLISGPPQDRTIHWYFDSVGNTGKSYLSKHLAHAHDAYYSNGGKQADIAYAYGGQKIVVFDYVRDSEAYVNYGVMEQLKNGMMFSPKYESGCKYFDPPHLLVFANFLPDSNKFSRDRLKMKEITADGVTVDLPNMP